MSIFKKLKSFLSPQGKRSQNFTNIKNIKPEYKFGTDTGLIHLERAECPYCAFTLEKPPSRKKKCPKCSQEMYIRTLPFDEGEEKIRVIATETMAEHLDVEWAKKNGTYDEWQKEKKRHAKMKQELSNNWGKEASESDVEWHLLMNERILHANNQQWGLYRNTTLRMAEHLYKLKKYELSLRTYLEVLYIDVNGPNNAGKINGQYEFHVRQDFRPFNPNDKSNTFLAPGVVKRVLIITSKRFPMDKESLQELFMHQCDNVFKALALLLTPEEAWSLIKSEITQETDQK
ncbi:hypothetical protein CVD28_11640 [Bacillus sp. M6-12]|uniref:hypothetical protein n=1 Tax=Bacillus sp. M6-12 TaxID=2054166 RepID=UPI000C76B547|nr:hypothetical protein [Bacillus sp. M6-12]PLS17636.1 hypothetical protein CVD28_11640 [Bacillus sp. M6-12]